MKTKGFNPSEIIFSTTTACNLHCKHCFINREAHKLDISAAVKLIESCVHAGGQPGADGTPLPVIDRIGFSGGEPFLYMDFLLEITKATIANDLLFDQIMTNGDWWRDETDLSTTLQKLYDAGYDGKFGLSWDSYHDQSSERMKTFIRTVREFFGEDSINIQRVEEDNKGEESLPLARTTPPTDLPVYTLPRTYPSDDPRAWQARRWFKEDYCQGPGNILYVHADGNIAPCCGFANENSELFIGTINDSLEEIMQKAEENKMLQICFQEGLSHYRRHGLKKSLRPQGKKLPGTTGDICTFCDYVCKINRKKSCHTSRMQQD
ncbi:MAG: 4Fe-4S cluster-binding domain-containing protein [Treponema sp.]|nr:4Fe-4S cluster-binding domain-containing protein [Treponema sp.]